MSVGLQKFASSQQGQLKHSHHHRQMVVSTDALSLDGLLDSVSSCGSFSSPPNSPIKAIRTKTYFGNYGLFMRKVPRRYDTMDSLNLIPSVTCRRYYSEESTTATADDDDAADG